MPIELSTPEVRDLPGLVDTLATWQLGNAPIQLHPGDLAWHWRHGGEVLAAAVRVWRRDGRVLAVGFLDGKQLVRLGIDPEAGTDTALADAIAQDVADPDRGLLARGPAAVESPLGSAVAEALLGSGWRTGVEWAALRRDLTGPVEDPGIRVEVVGPDSAKDYVAVQRASFKGSRFSLEQWQTLADSPTYRRARGLIAYDDAGAPVAGTTVWSAGEGRPGLIEPLGAHPDHRGRGYGTAITLAAASALREMGASHVFVKTEGHNAAGIGAYRSAGLVTDPPAPDLVRG